MNEPRRYEQLAAELDELAAVPTEVLAGWVTARGRCLWEARQWSSKDRDCRMV